MMEHTAHMIRYMLHMAGMLDAMIVLGIEYQKKTLSPELFAERVHEMLTTYQQQLPQFTEHLKQTALSGDPQT